RVHRSAPTPRVGRTGRGSTGLWGSSRPWSLQRQGKAAAAEEVTAVADAAPGLHALVGRGVGSGGGAPTTSCADHPPILEQDHDVRHALRTGAIEGHVTGVTGLGADRLP